VRAAALAATGARSPRGTSGPSHGRQPAAGEIAAHRRAEQQHVPGLDLAPALERVKHHQAAQAMPGEMRRPDALREARQPLGVRFQRPVAARVIEQVAAKSGGLQPRGERRHHQRRHPQAVDEDDVALRVQAAVRPGSAKMPLMRTMRLSPTQR
jgi:hypothetical protein